MTINFNVSKVFLLFFYEFSLADRRLPGGPADEGSLVFYNLCQAGEQENKLLAHKFPAGCP